MRHHYREWDGHPFASQAHLQLFDEFMELLLEYGDDAMETLKHLDIDPEQQQLLQSLIDEGLLEKIGATWKLTPRAINAIQHKALMEVFSHLKKGHHDGHETTDPGQSGERTEGSKPYQFGDPPAEIDINATLRNAVKRCGTSLPLHLAESDFEVHEAEHQASCSTVILLDMSGSMARYRRFYHAKKCAMAMHALIRQRFPQDTVDLVGFYSVASIIPEHRLPLLSPKAVTIFDYKVRTRVPLHRPDDGPQHFTNLQMGLMLARRILGRRGGDNKQVFIITDGQPTAHVQGNYVYLLFPPDRATAAATLQEALTTARQGIRLCTFALTEDYTYLDWLGFVDQLTRLTKGVAFYCAGGDLGNCIMESYLSGRKRKTYIA